MPKAKADTLKSAKQAATSVSTPRPQPKLYSSFLPIPLLLPTPTPVPSSSRKPLTESIHHIYVRPHHPKSVDEDLPEARTVFVANLPVDMGERDLRVVFGKWGVVEEVRFNGGDENALEKAVMGMEDEEVSEEEGEEEGRGEEEEEGGEGGTRAEPTFQGTGGPKLPRRLRPRRKPALPVSVPDLIPLPSLNPRSEPYGHSGLRCAHIIYLDPLPLTRLMAHPSTPIRLHSYPTLPTGLAYYTSLHSSLRPSLGAVKAFADSAMARFDHLHSLLLSSRAKKQGAGALVDEDGFTVVVRGGRYGRTGGRGEGVMGVGVAKKGFGNEEGKKKKSGGAGELTDFYRFQKVDRKRQELAGLRAKFEQDKAKVEEMKKSRRFKPY